jgi:hypothetical protein
MFTRKLRAAVLMVGAVLVGAVSVLAPVSASAATTAARTTTAAAAAPAVVAVRSGWFGLEIELTAYSNPFCLDSNVAGNVYVLPCQVPGNKFQDWSWTEWKAGTPQEGYYYYYSIQDQATGRCLDSNAAGQVYTTNPCQAPGNEFQDWYWGAGHDSNTSMFTDVATSRPLWGYETAPVSTSTETYENDWILIQ